MSGAIEFVELTSPGGETSARFAPDANLVCCSLTHRGAELLHQGQGVEDYAKLGKTFGIPLLHPWANRLAGRRYAAAGREVELPEPDGLYPLDGPTGLPIHGAMPGLLRWRVEDRDASRVHAVLDWDRDELLALFPFPHRLSLDAELADGRLTLVTTLSAGPESRVPVSFGYHPYLVVPGGLSRSRWMVSMPACERLVLDERMIPVGHADPLAAREFELADESWDDALGDLTSGVEFAVSGPGVRLSVVFGDGYSFGQVYAPPGHDLICFEPMTAPGSALVSGTALPVLAPGASHRAAFAIVVADNDHV